MPEKANKVILDNVRAAAYKPFPEILLALDRDLVKGALSVKTFKEEFDKCCKDEALAAAVAEILA